MVSTKEGTVRAKPDNHSIAIVVITVTIYVVVAIMALYHYHQKVMVELRGPRALMG